MSEAFIIECKNGNLKNAKLLYEQCDFELDYDLIDSTFGFVCENGYFEMAKYLYELGAHFDANNSYPFIHSSKNGHLEIVNWFCDLCDEYKYVINENNIVPIIRSFDVIINEYKIGMKPIELQYFDTQHIDICCVCLDNKQLDIKFNCNHYLCVDCFENQFVNCPICIKKIRSISFYQV